MAQTQEEVYFALSYASMNLCLCAYHHHVPEADVGRILDPTPAQVRRNFADVEAKRRAARYLRATPMLVRPIEEN